MNIHFSTREYRLLLDLLEISDWVLNAHRTETTEETEHYRAFAQKIYSFAGEMGFQNLISYDEESGEFLPTKEYEESSEFFRFIEEFEEHTFWDELISRLAERDLIRECGENVVAEMQPEDMFERRMALEQVWVQEFEANGLERLDVMDE